VRIKGKQIQPLNMTNANVQPSDLDAIVARILEDTAATP